jgi:integrating conjugative element protein (TIGR03759 family)
MNLTRVVRMLVVALLSLATCAFAAQPVPTEIGSTRTGAATVTPEQQTALDQTQAQVWGLTVAEIQRARLLMQPGSPRSAFSAPNISPVEVLGIHATNAAERQRYATLFAKALRADTERVLAWTVTYGQTAARLYPNEKVLDFGTYKIPKSQEIYLR